MSRSIEKNNLSLSLCEYDGITIKKKLWFISKITMWPKVTFSSDIINTVSQKLRRQSHRLYSMRDELPHTQKTIFSFCQAIQSWQLLHLCSNRKKPGAIRWKNNPHWMNYEFIKTALTVSEAHKGNLFLRGNKRKTTWPHLSASAVSVADANWVASDLLRCFLFWLPLCRLLQQLFIVTLFVTLLCYPDTMAHKITPQLLFAHCLLQGQW